MSRACIAWILIAAGCGTSEPAVNDLAVAEADLGGADDLSVTGDLAGDGGLALTDAAVTTVNHYLASDGHDYLQWKLALDHAAGTIMITYLHPQMPWSASGSLQALASGFQKVVFTAACDGAGCVPSAAGSTMVTLPFGAHVLEAPGYFVVLQPDSGQSGLGGVADTGGCSQIFADYNVIEIG